jgi:hypothetical protein
VYVVFLITDLGTVNAGLGVVVPSLAVAGGRNPGPLLAFGAAPSVGHIVPPVHEFVWLNHQVLSSRNIESRAFAGSASANSAAVMTATAANIETVLRNLKVVI